MPKDQATKPKKTYAEFPLTARANGQWCKKIRGKVHFFGVWAEADTAIQKYLDERDDLQAGRIPQRLSSVAPAKAAWPGTLPERFQAIRQALTARGQPATPEEIATGFSRAKKDQVAEILETLVTVGQARQTKGGKYVA